jgi:tetratricopeptide (TPR) repeat protein
MVKIILVVIFLLKATLADDALLRAAFQDGQRSKMDQSKEKLEACIANSKLQGERIHGLCKIHLARQYFAQKDYSNALKYYDLVEKADWNWPKTLLEKAWVYYLQGETNRSLGMLATYNSPLLSSYFNTEAEVLKALNYYKLCYFSSGLEIIEKYLKKYKPMFDHLSQISAHYKTNDYLKLLFTPLEESEKAHPYLRNIITEFARSYKYQKMLTSYYENNAQLYLTKGKKYQHVLRQKEKIEIKIAKEIKNQIDYLLEQTKRHGHELFKIKIAILNKKRKSLIKEARAQAQKQEQSKVVKESAAKTEQMWDFHQEFWADELGDYVFLLTSQC